MITIFGISNCQTVVKARNWLADNQLEYIFHDYKKEGIDKKHLEFWCGELGWEIVLNRSGMMYRKASDQDKAKIIDQNSAIEFMLRVPTSIKRPILEMENELLVGFVEKDWGDKIIN